ncbi:hypothetical protein U3516DRAFT_770666 [Neocallimastix sp. 'constans']
MKYNENMYVDGTFYAATKFGYQVFITRTYIKDSNNFYTTSFSTIKNKEQPKYIIDIYGNFDTIDHITNNKNLYLKMIAKGKLNYSISGKTDEINILIKKYKAIESKLIKT